ncbi:MAG: ABC transporter ATP-binding protein [Thalassospira sp.]|uniref:ABC transporter ATP-binding protein n=1 Tax=Thalassospira sp. TaxID=1912094 RepID=UPI0032EBBC20
MFKFTPRSPEQTGDDSPASSLWTYVWRMSGWHQVAVCSMAVLVAILGIAPVELQRRIVDDAISSTDIDLLIQLAVIYLAVIVAHGAIKYVLRLYEGWLSESAIAYNRKHLTRLHVENQTGDQNGDDSGNGRAVSIIGSEIEKLGGFVGDGLSQPVVNTGMLVFGLGYMISVEPIVGLIGVVALIPQIALVPVIQKRINHLIERRVENMRSVSDQLSNLSPDAPKDTQVTPVNKGISALFDNRMHIFVLKFGMKSLINLLNAFAPVCVLVVGGYLVIQGETSIGIVVAFISGFDRMSSPMRELLSYYRVAAQAAVQHRLIAKWMH